MPSWIEPLQYEAAREACQVLLPWMVVIAVGVVMSAAWRGRRRN